MNLFAGICLGTLFGVSMGLSSVPLVSTILSALIGIVTVFLSLKTTPDANAAAESAMLFRLSGFALAAVFGIVGGLTIRTNNLLSTSVTMQEYRELISMKFPEDEARAIVRTRMEQQPPSADSQRNNQSVLFSVTSDTCRELNPDNFSSANDVMTRYQAAGSPWTEIAELVSNYVKDDQKLGALKKLHAITCLKR